MIFSASASAYDGDSYHTIPQAGTSSSHLSERSQFCRPRSVRTLGLSLTWLQFTVIFKAQVD